MPEFNPETYLRDTPVGHYTPAGIVKEEVGREWAGRILKLLPTDAINKVLKDNQNSESPMDFKLQDCIANIRKKELELKKKVNELDDTSFKEVVFKQFNVKESFSTTLWNRIATKLNNIFQKLTFSIFGETTKKQ